MKILEASLVLGFIMLPMGLIALLLTAGNLDNNVHTILWCAVVLSLVLAVGLVDRYAAPWEQRDETDAAPKGKLK